MTMRRFCLLFIICHIAFSTALAQRITWHYDNVSISKALMELNDLQRDYTINFIYDELEDFKVTADVKQKALSDAISQIIGFYPIRVVKSGESEIFVECTHKTDLHLTGTIIDEQDQPVAYANVAILNPADSTLLSVGVSNESGYFAVPYEQETVLARVSYVGYKTVYRLIENPEVGTIRLQPDNYTLKGVTVKGHRLLYTSTGHGLLTKVQDTPLAQFGSATEMINHLPLMMSNGEIAGHGKPEIYINNKKVRDASELDRLRADDILSAEIITNPKAEYGADVKSVILLKTVRKQGEGWSGGFSGNYLQGEQWDGMLNASLNYRTRNGMDFFAKGNIAENNNLMFYPSKTELSVSSQWVYERYFKRNSRNRNFNTDLGWNWEISDNHSVGVTYTASSFLKGSRGETNQDEKVWQDGVLVDDVHTTTITTRKPKMQHCINAYYAGEIDNWKINFSADYYRNQAHNEMEGFTNNQPYAFSSTYTKNRLLAEKLSITAPVPKGSLTFGEEASNVNRTSEFLQSGFSYDNNIRQKTTTWAVFADYGLQVKKFSLDASLRWQHELNSYDQNGQHNDEVSRDYHVLVPRMSVGYSTESWNHTLAYSCYRYNPPYNILSSSIEYTGKYEYRTGNPFLQAQTHQIASWASQWKWIYAELRYDHAKNVYSDFHTAYDEVNHPGVILMDFRMVPNIKSYMAILNVSPKIGIWQLNYTAMLGYHDWDIEPLGITQKFKGLEADFSLDNTFTLPHSWLLNVQASFAPYHEEGFEQVHANGSLDFRISKQFLKDKSLSMALVANDILHTSNRNITQYNGIGYRVEVDVYRDQRRIGIDLSWKFNATHSRYKGSHAGQSERNRL